jgi:hypothetical protein
MFTILRPPFVFRSPPSSAFFSSSSSAFRFLIASKIPKIDLVASGTYLTRRDRRWFASLNRSKLLATRLQGPLGRCLDFCNAIPNVFLSNSFERYFGRDNHAYKHANTILFVINFVRTPFDLALRHYRLPLQTREGYDLQNE